MLFSHGVVRQVYSRTQDEKVKARDSDKLKWFLRELLSSVNIQAGINVATLVLNEVTWRVM